MPENGEKDGDVDEDEGDEDDEDDDEGDEEGIEDGEKDEDWCVWSKSRSASIRSLMHLEYSLLCISRTEI